MGKITKERKEYFPYNLHVHVYVLMFWELCIVNNVTHVLLKSSVLFVKENRFKEKHQI